ncbi:MULTISPECIES: tripartite tricarboxylate transporter substrate binding protein [unclassified Meiothermus]|uniref:Bug family tripartite tricarboxylate transporter substrate binding protein n=1 Tax=unclassified Meiothermus TaxID=370471 RepID=UPI000D7CB7F6|nr:MULTISPECIES: tripartite tricarboxylate transporter substrate binding protein [unclassified Meiothermus]PZA06207.1 tripartite tricarboxylate transporter substrate binding protein [Meiothermus sp. Pnk-1]RYM37458.1 tripartite tricarboxylate transporter substrate binding protein [Meiothermus sp. PNK-Is4]
MKRWFVLLAVLGVALSAATGIAQRYPARPITLIVPWSAGGSTDLTARALAPVLEKILGQPVQVVNRTGGGGAIGHGAIAQGRPDGYTLGIITLEVVLPPWVAQTKIDASAFAPVSLLVLNPVAIVVRKDAPWKSAQEFIADLKQNPGKYKASGTAKWGSYDFARLGFLWKLGLKDEALPWVPTQGAAAAMQELLSGGINVAFVSIGEASALVKSGEARFLAFMTDKRFPSFPEVPTLKEVGVDWTFASFLMAAAPKYTLPSVIDVLDKAFAQAVQDPDFVRFMQNANLVINHLDRKQSLAFLQERAKTMNQITQELGLKF